MLLHHVMKNPQLRRIAVFEDELQTAVMVDICESEGAAILRKIQPERTRNLRKRAIAVVREHHISFMSAPRVVRPDQLIESIPPVLVSQRGRCIFWGFRHHLAPEKTAEITQLRSPVRCSDVPIRDVEVRITIMIEVPKSEHQAQRPISTPACWLTF